jgi:hypothetical protein
VTAIMHARKSFDKDEIEAFADTWLVECGDKELPERSD